VIFKSKSMKTLIILLTIIVMATQGSQSTLPDAQKKASANFVTGTYPVFITRDLKATQQFYKKWFGYNIAFESSWFVLLSTPGDNPSLIAFMDETHPSSPPSPKAFKGDGAFLTIDVTDATSLYQELKSKGAKFSYDLKDEPWGQRRFALTDPNGLWVDVVQQIEPKAGWWDQYMK
jgi:catechol 2,3-dioxygenase-like lactoylglutathione lyase family enzyme